MKTDDYRLTKYEDDDDDDKEEEEEEEKWITNAMIRLFDLTNIIGSSSFRNSFRSC